MRQKAIRLLCLVLILLLSLGCSSQTQETSVPETVKSEPSSAPYESTVLELPTSEPEQTEVATLLDALKKQVPDAILYDSYTADLDGNGLDDCVFLYSTPTTSENFISTGLAVFHDNGGWAGTSLCSDKPHIFYSTPTYSCDQGITTISVYLRDRFDEDAEPILYIIEYTYDREENDTFFRVSNE